MLDDKVIKIENLAKRYTLGNGKTTSLRHTLQRYWQRLKRNKTSQQDFWALQHINLHVKRGEVLGIIGRNGAGKSTLLKILSRITPPTTGRIEINGRVASLLEVGTGFHPELTGRENIFLNGSLLGMTGREIRSKLNEIVDFSGVERFLDTPVKRYSSGMSVRLAFAVAAHLEPEILLIDEVLAVGDVAFQKKCLGKMNDVAQSGKTVIFVSHDMGAIEQLCTKCGWIDHGKLSAVGPPQQIIQSYLQSLELLTNQLDTTLRRGNGSLQFVSTHVYNSQHEVVEFLQAGKDYYLQFTLRNTTAINYHTCRLDVGINRQGSQRVGWLSTWLHEQHFAVAAASTKTIRVLLPKIALMPGIYSLTLYTENETGVADLLSDALFVTVESGPYFDSRLLPPTAEAILLIDHKFEFNYATKT